MIKKHLKFFIISGIILVILSSLWVYFYYEIPPERGDKNHFIFYLISQFNFILIIFIRTKIVNLSYKKYDSFGFILTYIITLIAMSILLNLNYQVFLKTNFKNILSFVSTIVTIEVIFWSFNLIFNNNNNNNNKDDEKKDDY